MKRKGIASIFAILLAVVLASIVIVPMVNASDPSVDPNITDGDSYTKYTLDALKIEQERFHDRTVDGDWSNITISAPIEDDKIISIIIPEKYLNEHNDSTDSLTVILSIESSEFNYQETTTRNQGKSLILKDIKPDENITILKVPELIFGYLNPDSKKVVIHFPIDHFKVYDNLSAYNNFNNQSSIISSDLQYPTNIQSPEESGSEELRASWHWYASRIYETISEDHSIIWVSGKIRPESYTNSGSDYVIWQEREILLNRPNDSVEFIVEYMDDPLNRIRIFCAVYDENVRHDQDSIIVNRSSLPHQYDYYFIMGKRGLGEYEMWFFDPITQNWYADFYTDYTPSTKINRVSGSSELGLDWDSQNYSFHARTSPISDEWNLDINDIWYKPSQLYTYSGSREDPYVGVWTLWDEYGTFHTNLYCDSQ